MELHAHFEHFFFADEDVDKYKSEALACKDETVLGVFVELLEVCLEYLESTELKPCVFQQVALIQRHDWLLKQLLIILEREQVQRWMHQLQEECNAEYSEVSTEEENDMIQGWEPADWPDQDE